MVHGSAGPLAVQFTENVDFDAWAWEARGRTWGRTRMSISVQTGPSFRRRACARVQRMWYRSHFSYPIVRAATDGMGHGGSAQPRTGRLRVHGATTSGRLFVVPCTSVSSATTDGTVAPALHGYCRLSALLPVRLCLSVFVCASFEVVVQGDCRYSLSLLKGPS